MVTYVPGLKGTLFYLEVLATSAQDDAVNFDRLSFRCQDDINESFFFEQRVKHGDESAMMVVPS